MQLLESKKQGFGNMIDEEFKDGKTHLDSICSLIKNMVNWFRGSFLSRSILAENTWRRLVLTN